MTNRDTFEAYDHFITTEWDTVQYSNQQDSRVCEDFH